MLEITVVADLWDSASRSRDAAWVGRQGCQGHTVVNLAMVTRCKQINSTDTFAGLLRPTSPRKERSALLGLRINASTPGDRVVLSHIWATPGVGDWLWLPSPGARVLSQVSGRLVTGSASSIWFDEGGGNPSILSFIIPWRYP